MPLTRARFLTSTAAAALLALTACGSGSGDDADGAGTPTASGSASGAFPVTVETKFGPVTVPERPLRVVALGWGDAEAALALGVQPVGASDWLAFGGEGVGPWAEGRYDTPPEILGTLELSYEAVAALQPDLILDTKSSGDQTRYDRLSQIAPTVGVPEGGDSYLTSTQEQMELVSQALGEAEQGQQLLDDVTRQFADAAAAHPQWEGKTVTAATRTSEGWGAYVEGSERVQFLERLGFVQNPKIAALPVNSGGFSVDVSAEQLGAFDADAIVAFPIYIESTQITEDPLWKAVPAVADGRAVVLEDEVSNAYSLGGVLSTGYALEKVVPLLEGVQPAS